MTHTTPESPAPDVSVIVAVYNTMPYLTQCMESLVNQSIGPERIEVVAVNDGSTDGSGSELERFAREYPGIVRVLHQENSGGPAAPRNRALDVARGRYVFFVDSDDYLGDEALERLVDKADEWESDVIFGTMVGVNGRTIWQEIFKSTERDLDLYGSGLPFTLATTKLYRRELIEKYALRYPEDLPIGEDQPFAIEALVRSRRTSVLNDYTYYYAVKRTDSSNITYAISTLEKVRCTGKIMDFVADLIEVGPRRDAVLRRHYQWELTEPLQFSFLEMDEAVQRELCGEIGRLVDAYLTDNIRDLLPVSHRVRLGLARAGEIERLRKVIRAEYGPDRQPPQFVSDGDRILLGYPGFDDGVIGDEYYEYHDRRLVRTVGSRLSIDVAFDDDGALSVEADLPFIQRTGEAFAEVVLKPIATVAKAPKARKLIDGERSGVVLARAGLSSAESGRSSWMRTRIDPASLIVGKSRSLGSIRLQFSIGDTTFDFPLPAVDDCATARVRHGVGNYKIDSLAGSHGQLVTQVSPPPLLLFASVIVRRVRRLGRRSR